jgi:TPR repeat protein
MSTVNVPGLLQAAISWAPAILLAVLCVLVVRGEVSASDYPPKVQELMSRAEDGDVAARVELGSLFLTGKGAPKDRWEAMRWFTMAAKLGHAEAQYQLALIYDSIANDKQGKEERRSPGERSREWLDRAAKQGHAKAARKLQEKFRQAEAAAQRGDAGEQARLGHMYEAGLGVAPDHEEAVKWYRKAALQGDKEGMSRLCSMSPLGCDEAVEGFRKAAEQGEARAQCNLGWAYEKGFEVRKSYEEAVKWYRKAAEQGDPEAQNKMGLAYYNGFGVAQDYEEAVKWFRRAAEQGDAQSQNGLGNMYRNGFGVAQNYEDALKWYGKAAEQGNALAQVNLGNMYKSGSGVAKNLEEAMKWYRKAAEQGNGNAEVNLRGLAQSDSIMPESTTMSESDGLEKLAQPQTAASGYAMIDGDDVMPRLLIACPSFRHEWEENVAYHGRELLYAHLGYFASHLVELLKRGETTEFPAVFAVVEELHLYGDFYVREAATIGLLEGIQNTSGGVLDPELFKQWLLPVSAAWWDWLNRIRGTEVKVE